MKTILISIAAAFLVTSACAAPLFNQANSIPGLSIAENVKIVCEADGFCYRPAADPRLSAGFMVTMPFMVPMSDLETTEDPVGTRAGGGGDCKF